MFRDGSKENVVLLRSLRAGHTKRMCKGLAEATLHLIYHRHSAFNHRLRDNETVNYEARKHSAAYRSAIYFFTSRPPLDVQLSSRDK